MNNQKQLPQELVEKFRQIPPSSPYTGVGDGEAIKCAQIAVDFAEKRFRKLIDLTWGFAYEDGQVPSTKTQDYLIHLLNEDKTNEFLKKVGDSDYNEFVKQQLLKTHEDGK